LGSQRAGLSHRPKAKKQLSLFSKVLFNSFWNFLFLKNAKDEKIKYVVEKEKNKMVDF
jgi:hypothetical protein